MKYLRILGFLGICLVMAPYAHAQGWSVGIGIGPGYYGPPYVPHYVGVPPLCRYGYCYPYTYAPYLLYGPRWFVGGVFIGAGPRYGRGYYYGGPRYYYGRPGYYYGRAYYYGGRGYRGGYPAGAFRGGGGLGFHRIGRR